MDKTPGTQNGTRHSQTEAQERRGQLRIFLGYAAGVGTTYAMLESAQQRRAEGVDVVIGYVDPHGSGVEISNFIQEMEYLPHQEIRFNDTTSWELNTDALLQRRPQLTLVDDLAHTNAPGSRYVHRYQDVLELLNSGIDVYTTLNIQHLESLNDVVKQVTGVKIHETVPDYMVDEAQEIILVDLPVDELLARLEAGKVNISGQLEQARQKFYRPGNLTALREIAFRRAADRVDEQMRAYMQKHAISGPWPASERLLVCVSPSPLSERLVRTSRRMARRLNAEWIAAYVEGAGQANLSEVDEKRVTQTLRLAEALGAQIVRLSGHSVARTLVDYARSHNVTKIVAGKPLRPRWRKWWQGSIIDELLSYSQAIDVYVISGKVEAIESEEPQKADGQQHFNWRSYLLSAGLVLLATIMGLPLSSYINPTNLVMLYLAVVMVTAVWLGRWPAIVASLLSVIAFDIFFVPHYYTFAVADAEYLLTFAGLLAVGLVISTLAARAQEQALASRRRETQTAISYELSQALASASSLEETAQTVVNHSHSTFDSPAALFLPNETGEHLILQSRTPDFYPATDGIEVADWVFHHDQPAGRHTDTLAAANSYYLPLQTSGRVIGVLAIESPENDKGIFTREQRRFLDSFSSQVALALERINLSDQARRAQLLVETEKLQATLLSSISHDLRTPLATITGALSSLLDDADLLSAAAQRDLVLTAWEEALRLNRLVGNLLDMTRLESGAMKVVHQPYDVQELVGATLAHMPNRLQDRSVKLAIPDSLPPVAIDLTLMVQALMNLVDNALKYAPVDQAIEIDAYQEQQEVIIAVKDRGPGIPETELENIFTKFYRANSGQIGGTGLGLSIAKGIVEAHSGRIWAQNRPDGGAAFMMALPLAKVEIPPEE